MRAQGPAGVGMTARNETLGLWLGLLGVVIFAMTLPMTRLAVGPSTDPQLAPLFVTAGRAAFAGLLSAFVLLAMRASRPRLEQALALAVCAAGTVVGFPLFLALALREVDAMHAAVVTGLLPLGTALAAALYFRQRPSLAFWASAVLGCGLVVAFAVRQGQGHLSAADGLLLLAVLAGSIGYVAGARLAAEMQPACDLLGAGVLAALDLAGDAVQLAPAAGAPVRLVRSRVCFILLHVVGLFCLVPRPRARRRGAGQSGATGAAVFGATVRGAGVGRETRARDRCVFIGGDCHRVPWQEDAG